jgi:hypothetical protein
MHLFNDIVEPDMRDDANNTTSSKPWALSFATIEEYTFYKPQRSVFDALLGPLFPDDTERFSYDTVDPPEESEYTVNEADVTRLFLKQISGIVMPHYRRDSFPVIELSQSAPFDSDFSGFVDSQFVKAHNGKLVPLTIGEMKAPGTIDRTWSSDGNLSSGAKRLGRELRG